MSELVEAQAKAESFGYELAWRNRASVPAPVEACDCGEREACHLCVDKGDSNGE